MIYININPHSQYSIHISAQKLFARLAIPQIYFAEGKPKQNLQRTGRLHNQTPRSSVNFETNLLQPANRKNELLSSLCDIQ